MRRKNSESLIVWQQADGRVLLGARCAECDGLGRLFSQASENPDCPHCSGAGWFGIHPEMPVQTTVGTTERIAMMTVRYANGLPLWNANDGTTIAAEALQRVLYPENLPDPAVLTPRRRPSAARRKSAQPRSTGV